MTLTKYKALTFDCYGTLIDWESGMFAALQPLVARVPRKLTRDEILEAHARAEGERAAQLVLAAAAADLTAAARIVSAARPRTEPAVSAVPQAGGELGMSEVEVAAPPQDEVGSTPAPSFPQRVRAQIESRAALVVACTGTPTLAIRATWGAQGLVLFEPVGVSSPDVVECVQAAIGELPVGGPPGSLLHAVGR